jgi:hypothetical protein
MDYKCKDLSFLERPLIEILTRTQTIPITLLGLRLRLGNRTTDGPLLRLPLNQRNRGGRAAVVLLRRTLPLQLR